MLGLSGVGAVVNVFTFGGNGLLSQRINGVDGFLTFDPSGNTVQSLSSSQSVNYSHLVTGFGSQLVGGSTSDAYDGLGAQWGYRRESGNLFLLGHRYYSSQRGQFLTRDPIGYEGGVNLYGYTGNNPVNQSDPSGFCSDGGGDGLDDARDANPLNLFNPIDAYGMSNDAWTRAGNGSGTVPAAFATSALAGLSIYGAGKAAVVGAAGMAMAGWRGIAGLAAAGADLVADGSGTTLNGMETVYRVMSQAELDATETTGLMRGGRDGIHYASDAAYTDALRARQRLALPQTPELEVKLEVPAGRFSSSSRVQPLYNMPGGGMERSATGTMAATVLDVKILR